MARKSFFILSAALFFAICNQSQGATLTYRSVGVGATGPLAADTDQINTLIISSTTATFSSDLPGNIGVGDVIEYDANNDGFFDAVAFIHGRTNARTFTVRNAAGGTPVAKTSLTIWAIYRAYTSLSDAASGVENTGLAPAISNFDAWSQGYDLTTTDLQWNIVCYGPNADATPTNFDGTYWVTDATRFLRIYSPYAASEVGTSQRHAGVWSDLLYRLQIGNSTALTTTVNYIRIEGLQVRISAVNAQAQIAIYFHPTAASDLRVSGCILRGIATSAYDWHNAVDLGDQTVSGAARIWNNIIYEFYGRTNDVGLDLDNLNYTVYAFNNTIVRCGTGIMQEAGTVVARNNLVQASTVGFSGTFDSGSDYNISNVGDAPGTNTKNATAQFVNSASYNYHLAQADTVARHAGVNSSVFPMLPFNDDIDLETRPMSWDVGADQCFDSGTPTTTPTGTPWISPSQTPSLTRTITRTITQTPTPSPTRTASGTPSSDSPTVSPTASLTATATPSETPLVSPTHTFSVTPQFTATPTPTPSPLSTRTQTLTPTLMALGEGEVLAYPSPAKGSTVWFYYHVEAQALVKIEIFNTTGERCAAVEDSSGPAAYLRTPWEIRAVAPGIYLYRISVTYPDRTWTSRLKKIVIVKK